MVERTGEIAWVTASPAHRRRLVELLSAGGFRTLEYETTLDALAGVESGTLPSLVFLEVDPKQKRVDERTARLVRGVRPVPVIAVPARAESAALVRSLAPEVAGYLIPPFDDVDLERVIASVSARRRRQSSVAREPIGAVESAPNLIARSSAMRELERRVRRIAETDMSVVIRGESGTGKDLVARCIHAWSSRRENPFVKINCAAIPDPLLESELFGYERGAFTGADERKPGRFEMAHQGTIFLDEIVEMSLPVQAKLLQVLQDSRFTPLGSDREMQVDVRVVAACSKGPEQEVEEGRFREDLYFRLHGVDVALPALRDRKEEIPALVEHYLHRFAVEYQRPRPELGPELLERFLVYSWPGNVRELQNMLRRIVLLGDERSVMRRLVGGTKSIPGEGVVRPDVSGIAGRGESRRAVSLKQVARRAALAAQKELVLETLNATRWNRRKAARLLGVSYNTLLSRIQQFGLNAE